MYCTCKLICISVTSRHAIQDLRILWGTQYFEEACMEFSNHLSLLALSSLAIRPTRLRNFPSLSCRSDPPPGELNASGCESDTRSWWEGFCVSNLLTTAGQSILIGSSPVEDLVDSSFLFVFAPVFSPLFFLLLPGPGCRWDSGGRATVLVSLAGGVDLEHTLTESLYREKAFGST